jgi:hypothetical protein
MADTAQPAIMLSLVSRSSFKSLKLNSGSEQVLKKKKAQFIQGDIKERTRSIQGKDVPLTM